MLTVVKWVRIAAAVLSAALLTAGSDGAAASQAKRVAIVIDDFGNGMSGTDELLHLPVKLTVAVMPFLPTTAKDAAAAHDLGHDVIVHLPMEPVHGKKEWLGPGAITTDLSTSQIRARVEAAVDQVPYAVGMNNHMGSQATADRRVMDVVMAVCRERGLFFLDSRTTSKSVVREAAQSFGVPYVANNLFLDERYEAGHIMRQLGLLRRYLDRHDTAVAIGHVGPPGKLTARAIRQTLPAIGSKAEFVTVAMLASGGQPQLPNLMTGETYKAAAERQN